MVRHARFVNIFILVGFMFGCSTANPTSISTDITSPLLTATAEATRTRPPTATRRPSSTPSPSPTISLTETAIYQDTLTAQVAEETLAAQFLHVCETAYGPREYSPNGLWMAEFCYSEKDQDYILTISKKRYTDFVETAISRLHPANRISKRSVVCCTLAEGWKICILPF